MKISLQTTGERFIPVYPQSKQIGTSCPMQGQTFDKSVYSGKFNVSADYYNVSFGVSKKKNDLEIKPMSEKKAIQTHKELFEEEPKYLSFAPGRGVLLGEHIDNYGGLVLPFAINAGTMVTASKRNDSKVIAYSEKEKSYFLFDLNKPADMKGYKYGKYKGRWGNYVEGMVRKVTDATGHRDNPQGMNLYINGNIPGSGLSSSASLEMAVGKAALAVYADIDNKKLAKLGQETEHEFAGVKCGIMDQNASACSKKGTVLALDCRNNDIENIPANFDGYSIIICDSKVKHTLGSSPYNAIVKECKSARQKLKTLEPFRRLKHIADIDMDTFEENIPGIRNILTESEFKRVRHIVSENHRAHECAKALRDGDIEYVGELMNQTHQSLADDMRVSCSELNEIQNIAVTKGGAIGSRMMGGGFGGNVISLVPNENVQKFVDAVAKDYYNPKFPNQPLPVSIVKPEQGAYKKDLK